MKPVLQILPTAIRKIVQALPRAVLSSLEEIRVRQNRPLEIITGEETWFVSESCQLTHQVANS